MQIPVPDSIASAALGGNTGVLTEVSDAFKALKAAQEKAQRALQPEVAQVLADGLARSKAANGESAQMVITEEGALVVRLGESHEPTEAPEDRKVVVAQPYTQPESPKETQKVTPPGPPQYPSLDELRQRAEAAGVDISDLDGRKKKEILDRIEVAENAAPEPSPAQETPPEVVEPTEEDEEDDHLGLDVAPDEEPVESPENVGGAEPVIPPEVDVDSWLDD